MINHAFKKLGMNSILATCFEKNLGVKSFLKPKKSFGCRENSLFNSI